MNPWGYQPQPYFVHPNVYMPPQPYVRANSGGFWEQAYPQIVAPAVGHQSAKYPHLNPILAADTTQLRFDVRKKPRTDIITSTYYSNRHSPVTSTFATSLRIISKSFPWTVDIKSNAPLTCESVWDALYAALQEHIADSEWGLIIHNKKAREATEKAAKKRIETDGDKAFKRIDLLGDATLFKGLEKDEDFAELRLLPGDSTTAETWVVKFIS